MQAKELAELQQQLLYQTKRIQDLRTSIQVTQLVDLEQECESGSGEEGQEEEAEDDDSEEEELLEEQGNMRCMLAKAVCFDAS